MSNKLSSSEGVNLIFENNKLLLQRKCDIFMPNFILSKEPIQSIDIMIKDIRPFGSNNEILLTSLPLLFCNKLCNFEMPDSLLKYSYKIPWELLNFDKIPLAASKLFSITFKINSHEICAAQLLGTNTYVGESFRCSIIFNSHSLHFKQFKENSVSLNEGINNIDCDFNGIDNGFFLDNIKMRDVDNMKIIFDGNERLNYRDV